MCQKPFMMAGSLCGTGNGNYCTEKHNSMSGFSGAAKHFPDNGREKLPELAGAEFS